MPSRKLISKLICLLVSVCTIASSQGALTWYFATTPADSGIATELTNSMNSAVASYNTYSNYTGSIPVAYNSGVPTAQSSYGGTIEFGGSRNYRTAMHEMSHWLGTGTYSAWAGLMVNGRWIGGYGNASIQAYDGPSAVMGGDTQHYWPYGWNYDSEAVYPEREIGMIGAFRRDMGLSDMTIGIAPGTYRLRNRATLEMLDNNGSATDGAQVQQKDNSTSTGQQWVVTILTGGYFSLQCVSSSKYLDSLGNTADGSAIGQSASSASTTQQWQIVATDSGYYKIVNRSNGKCLDAGGQTASGTGLQNWTTDTSLDQEWKFVSTIVQTLPATGVLSQSMPVTASSNEAGNEDLRGNDGAATTRWTASTGTYPQWWRVDLGTSQPITKVVTDWFNATARSYQYRIETSTDDTTYTTALDRTANTTQGTTTDTISATARYLRLTVTGATAGYAALWESRVFNDTTPMQLVSQFRPATASTVQAANLVANGNDGNQPLTRWTASTNSYPQWWRVDLGSIQPVHKAFITWFNAASRAYQYRIETSLDDSTYTTAVDNTANATYGNTVNTFSAIARYVRVTITGVTPSGGYAAFNECQIFRDWTPVPSPWSTSDIGAVAATGSASYNGSVFTVTGSGADIAGTADEFRIIDQAGSGDCSVTARVASLQNTNAAAKSGVMIRETTGAGSAFAAVFITPGSGVSFQRRTSTGGTTGSTLVTGVTAPRWVRITRTGSAFAAYYSSNGTTWTQIGSSVSITMATSVRIALALTSHNDGTLCNSILDNVTATP